MGKRRTFPITLISIAVIMMAAEGAARLMSPSLPAEPGKWPRIEMSSKYDQMRRYLRRGMDFPVVFVGSSMTVNGVEPVVFTEETEMRSYNAAFPGASPRSLRHWTLDVIEPMLSPEIVFVEVSSRDLNTNGKVHRWLRRSLLRSPGYRQVSKALDDRLEGWIEEHSAFMRYRREFRQPAKLMRDLTRPGEGDRHRKYGWVGRYGRRIARAAPYEMRSGWAKYQQAKVLNNFRPGGEELTALTRMKEELDRRDVDMVLLSMPITEDYVGLHPRGRADIERFDRVIRRFARKHDLLLIDAQFAFDGVASFKDPVHLDGPGAVRFTKALARRWREGRPGERLKLEVR